MAAPVPAIARNLVLSLFMRILFILVVASAAFSAYLLVAQHSLIYFPRKLQDLSLPAGIERISYQSESMRQTAYYLAASDQRCPSPKSLWVLLGGNASLALDWLPFASRYRDEQTAFLLFDYPGYGESEGKACPGSIQQSLLDCLHSLPDRLGLPISEVIGRTSLIGHSLGAAVALQFADRFPVQNIILLAPFTSMLEMAKRTVPFPFYHLLRHRYDNLAVLDHLTAGKSMPAITLFHGSKDQVVPVSMARTLALRYPRQIKYIEIDGADHNTILDVAEPTMHRIMRQTGNASRNNNS